MKKQTKLIGIVAGAVVLLLLLGYVLFTAPVPEREKWVYVEEEVKRGTLTVAVTESGSLEYGISSVLYDLDLNVMEADEEKVEEEETTPKYLQVEEVYVASGQRIQEGDALVRFTQDSVEDIRMLLEDSVVDARASYLEAEREYERSALTVKTSYDSAKIVRKYANDIYEDTSKAVDDEITSMNKEIGVREDMTTFLEEKIEEAQKEYDEADKAYKTAKKALSSAGTRNVPNYLVLNNEYLEAQTRYYNAQSALKQAKENLEKNEQKIGELEEGLEDAKARVAIDKLDVKATYDENTKIGDNAQIVYNAAIIDLKKTLEEEANRLREREEQLEAFEAFVGDEGILYAKEEGIVTEVASEKGDRLVEESTLMTYAAPRNMTIAVDVAQEDVVALKTGDAVAICFDAHPDILYNGTIQTISTTATQPEASAVSYQVVVGVNGDTTALYRGMTADIIFVTWRKENALYVSEKAIVEEEGKTYVYVQTVSGGYALKEVETGICGDMGVEILSGLAEGDIIYIAMKESDVSSGSVSDNDVVELNPAASVSSGDAILTDVSGGDAIGTSVSDGDTSDRSNMPGGEERP